MLNQYGYITFMNLYVVLLLMMYVDYPVMSVFLFSIMIILMMMSFKINMLMTSVYLISIIFISGILILLFYLTIISFNFYLTKNWKILLVPSLAVAPFKFNLLLFNNSNIFDAELKINLINLIYSMVLLTAILMILSFFLLKIKFLRQIK